MLEIILLTAVIFVASVVQGLSGFGSALVSMPLLTLFLGVKTVAPMVALYCLVITVIIFIQLREHFSVRYFLPLIVGAVFGVPVGIYFLKHFDERIVKYLMGIILIGYSLYSLFWQRIRYTVGSKWGYLFGFISGCLGGAFNTTGPPVVIYTTLKPWNKHEIKVTMQSYFVVCNILIVTMHVINGLTTVMVLKYFLWCMPPMAVGLWVGTHFYNRINQEMFHRIIYVLLFLLGILMFIKH